MEIQNDPEIQWSLKMKSDPNKRDDGKFYRFHDDHGHNVDECIHLKRQIETFIQQGCLQWFTAVRIEEPFINQREACGLEN